MELYTELQSKTQQLDVSIKQLRKSGTEPVIRIMVEHESIEKCKEYVLSLYEVINKKGYSIVKND